MFWSQAATATLALAPLLASACFPGLHRRDAVNTTDEAIEIRVAPRPPPTTTALTNVRVFDGYTVQPPGTVYINGDIIIANATAVDTVIDGQGAILLPGLIDSHCHPAKIAHLETLSSYGITTALSMACNDYRVCASLHSQIGLTDYITAGYPAVGPNSSHSHGLPPSRLITSPAEASAWVQDTFDNGGSYLKIVAELNGPDQATQNALVAAAHAIGRKSMTHAALHDYYVQAILSRTDGPQHVPTDGVLNDTMLQVMVAQNQFATPTMNVFRYIFANINEFGPQVAAAINTTLAYEIVQQNVRVLRARGIPILAGTDSVPVGLFPFAVPFGSCLHDELANLAQAGLDNAEVIR